MGDVLRVGDVEARDPMDSMTRGSNPVLSTRKICKSFSESKCCADLSVCPTKRSHTLGGPMEECRKKKNILRQVHSNLFSFFLASALSSFLSMITFDDKG